MRRKIFPNPLLLFGIVACGSLFLFSCIGRSKNDIEIIKAMEESLTNSNTAINSSSQTILFSLNNKLTDPVTSYKAKIWYPKAQLLQELTSILYIYIEQLKGEKGLTYEKSAELFQSLKKYTNDILAVDPYINRQFNNIVLVTNPTGASSISEKDFYNNFFNNSSKESVNAFLTKLQNNVKVIESRTITFCNEQVGVIMDYFDTYSVIIGQNCQTLMPGKYIEITSGVGAFSSRRASPKITFNGIDTPLNESGVSVYKQKVSKKPGNYSVPVKIQFTDENGKENTIERIVKYTVAKECDQ